MNILITGSSGFIGYNLAKKLLETGHQVIGIDNENDDYDPAIKSARSKELSKLSNFEFFKKDIVHDDIASALKSKQVAYFIHLAARDLYYDKPFNLDYSRYVESQALGTAKMFELAKKLQAKKFIYASTHSVYGNTKKGLLTEKKILPNPISPHGASKLSAEKVIGFMSNYHQLPAVILRISSVYGSGMTPHMLIPSVIKAFRDNGSLDPYSDFSKTTRDFIYIDDVVQYITSTFNKRLKFQIINIASGKSVRLIDVIKKIAEIMNKKITDIKVKEYNEQYRRIIVEETEFDITRAQKILHYTPQTSLEEGLRATVGHFSH